MAVQRWLGLVLMVFVVTAWGGEEPAITVTGTGEVHVAPDMAVLRFGSVAEADRARKAQEQVNADIARALAALTGLNIPEARVATETLRLEPIYANTDRKARRIVGYRALNGLRVELRDPKQVGQVIDAVTGAGINQLSSLNFTLQDVSAARTQALQQAAKDAQAKAHVLAEALKVRLIDLQQVSESVESPPAPIEMTTVRFGSPTPTRPGQLSVRASVTLRFGFSP